MSRPSSLIDSLGTARSEPRAARQMRLAVRGATAALALLLVVLAFFDKPVLPTGSLLGPFQWALLITATWLGALCLAPLSWNQKGLTLLVSIAASLLLAELVVRAFLGPRFLGIYQRDARVLYRLIPGAQRVSVLPPINGGAVIRYRINSLGFRGDELLPAGQATRVLVYGDSFIQGDFARTEDTFAAQLQRRLAAAAGHKSLEVVNAGVAGYGPDQELRRMEDELPALRPSLVVVAIYAGNDFGDLLRDKLYRLSSEGSLEDNPSVFLDDALQADMRRSRSEPVLRKVVRAARARLFGTDTAPFPTGPAARRARVDADLQQGTDEYHQYIIQGDNAVHDLYSDPYNADVSLTPASDSARYKIAMMEQIMRRMAQSAARSNAALVFVLIPSPIDATDEHESGEVDAAKYPEYRRSALTDILEQICHNNGLRVIDLFGPFWQRRADGLYLKGNDDHWNARGQAYAAELVSEFVLAQNLLGNGTSAADSQQRTGARTSDGTRR
jgi:lysophospholipase L1-like esterase